MAVSGGAAVSADIDNDRDDIDEEYRAFVEEWHEDRVERLKEEQGWLRLTGLYWLSEGGTVFWRR